ncbi:MAG: hypothetical protein CMJ39_01070 [Phycisphaerae bacterium]|nr:hypothetical protein [Phycisphaerae bacterium]
MNIRRTSAYVLLIAICGMLAFELPRAIASRVDGYRWFDPVVDVHGMIVDDFVKNANRQAMQSAVIKAMVESLDDRYTEYVPPQLEEDFVKDLSGDYAGIGARINNRGADYESKPLEIITPMIGSPALAAGVRPGDKVLTIDGWETTGNNDSDCIERLMGPPGTKVAVKLLHTDGTEEDTVITRNRILTSNVYGLMMTEDGWRFDINGDGLAYIRIDQFTDRTVNQLREAMKDLEKQGKLNGLILDLRDNPGGALQAAVGMADLFLKEGEIVNIRSPREDKNDAGRPFRATRSNTYEDLPLIVMINDRSASASEIVAGALSDHERAIVMGERSYGKGSVQELRPIPGNNGMLKMTTKYYFLPSGRHIQRPKQLSDEPWGVDPSTGCTVAESQLEERDRILARRPFEAVGGEYVEAPSAIGEEWANTELKDAALGEAITLMEQRLDGDDWPTLEPDEDPAYISTMVQLENLLEQRERIMKAMVETQDEIDRLEGLAGEPNRGLGLEDDLDLEEPVIAIYDAEGNLVGRWKVGSEDDLQRTLSAVELSRLDQDAPAGSPEGSSEEE